MTSRKEELALLLSSIAKKFEQQMHCMCLESSELSHREISLIFFIGQKENVTMGEIADELRLTPGTVTLIIDKLIDMGYLKRERDESIDRRKVFIFLTKRAQKLFDEHMLAKLKVAEIMLSSFDTEESKNLLNFMKKIDDNLTVKKEND